MEMNEDKAKRNKILTAAVVVFLIAVFVIGFIWGLDSVLAMEGDFPPVINKEALTPEPESAHEADIYLEKLVAKADKQMPASSSKDDFEIDAESLKTDGSPELSSAISYVRSSLCDYVDSLYKGKSTDYSTPIKVTMPVFNASDVIEYECNYIYYKCGSCGEESDEPLDCCEKCGSTYPYDKMYSDEYEIIISLDPSSQSVLKNNFNPRTQKETDEILKSGLKNIADASNFRVEYTALTVTFKVNRLTDEITSLSYKKDMNIAFNLKFKGDYKKIGTAETEFSASETRSFDFTWPSLKLNEETMVIEPKGEDNLLATLTCDDPTAYEIKWTSSDDSIVSVDGEGYMKAHKKVGEATVTASFDFNGKTYSDSCLITVHTPVESIELNKRKLNMEVGEKYNLDAKVSPRKATIKSVTWYSENEKIASVDENGNVTALKAGDVIIYALSDDGYYKSSCEVNIE